MDKDQFRAALRALGWTQEMAGLQLGITDRSVRRFLTGEWPVTAKARRILTERMKDSNL